jgi:hypothetical protein
MVRDRERLERFIREAADEDELQAVLDYCYGGSIERYLESMDLRSGEDLDALIEDWGGETNARRLIYNSVHEDFRDVEEMLEKERRHDGYRCLVVPLMEQAVRYARRHPDIYSIRENESSTYIYGPGGVIRFSDHPQKVDYDSAGRPIVRGGWAKRSELWEGSYYPAADYSLDPSNADKIDWEDVQGWLEIIARDEDDIPMESNPPHWASKRIPTTHWGWVVDGKVYDFLTHEPEDGAEVWDHGQAARWLMEKKPELARRTLEMIRKLPGGSRIRSLDDLHWHSSLFTGFEHAGAVRFLVQPPVLEMTTAFLDDSRFRDKIGNLSYAMRSLARHAEQGGYVEFSIGGSVKGNEIKVSRSYVLDFNSRAELVDAAEQLEVIDRKSKLAAWLKAKGA